MKTLRLDPIEGVVVTLGFLMSVGATYALWMNLPLAEILFGWKTNINQPRVGEVSQSEGNLRRKSKSSPGFYRIETKKELYNYDTLVTGDNSKATLTLDDGSEIDLAPRSMITLAFESDLTAEGISRTARVQVLSGEVSGRAKKYKVILKSKGREIKLKKGGQSEAIKAAPPKVKPKEIQVITQNDLDYLESLEAIETKPKIEAPVPKAKPKPPTLTGDDIKITSFKDQQVFAVDPFKAKPERDVALIWRTAKSGTPVRATLTHADTKETVIAKEMAPKGVKGTIKTTLKKPGVYVFRLYDASNAQLVSEKSFVVDEAFPGIEVMPPLIGGKVIQSNEFQGDHFKKFDITLRWKRYPKSRKYKVSFHRTADTKSKPIFERTVGSTEYVVKKNKKFSGTFFYRISTKLPSGFVAHSGPVEFRFDFLPPVLALPKSNSVVGRNELRRLKGKVLMTWRKTNFTESYILEVSKQRTFQTTVINTRTPENFFIWKGPPRGTFYWRVRSEARGRTSAPSLTGVFSIAP